MRNRTRVGRGDSVTFIQSGDRETGDSGQETGDREQLISSSISCLLSPVSCLLSRAHHSAVLPSALRQLGSRIDQSLWRSRTTFSLIVIPRPGPVGISRR